MTHPKTTTSTSNPVLFSQPQNVQDQKKKKKVRPEEKQKIVETHQQKEDADEGFSIVRKKIPVYRPQTTTNENLTPEEKEKRMKNKGAFLERNNKVPTGKRQFERQSGTGRGKEISKGGAGGKFTWGNYAKNIPKDTPYKEEDTNWDDRYFNRALNAKPSEGKPEEKTEEAPVEKEVVEKPEQTEEPVEKQEEEPKEWRKKKKGGAVEEKKEDLLERPENALSYSEYLDQLKQKNQGIKTTHVEVKRPDEGIELKPHLKNVGEDELGIESTQKKGKINPKKAKKPDQKEVAINQLVAVKTEDETEQRRGYNNEKGYGKKKGGNNFKYNPEEFPEL